jgi:hypothetical protein
MKLSIELPTKYLAYFSRLTDLDFCLAQVALQDAEYAKFFNAQAKAGRMVILDNGFHEMGRPLSVPELEKAVELVEPSFVVAPDAIGKPVETFDWFEQMEKRMRDHPSTRLAAVVVGLDSQERAAYFNNVAPRCAMLCLPYREPRRTWFTELLEQFPRPRWPEYLHLLGMNEFEEVNWFKRFFIINGLEWGPHCVSVDTAKPLKWGLEKKLLNYDSSPRGSSVSSATLHNISSISDEQLVFIMNNIAYLRRFV